MLTYIYIYMYIYMCLCVFVSIHTSVDEYMHACICPGIHKPILAHMQSTYMCASVNMHMFIRTWTSRRNCTRHGPEMNAPACCMSFFFAITCSYMSVRLLAYMRHPVEPRAVKVYLFGHVNTSQTIASFVYRYIYLYVKESKHLWILWLCA